MWNPKRFKYLAENEIAGAETMNPIVEFIRGIRSTDDYIMLNPNPLNSMDINLDMDALREWALNALPFNTSLEHTFKASVSDNGRLSCTGGNVWFPDDMASISALSSTSCHNNYMVYIRLTSKTQGTLVYDNGITHTLMTGNNDYRVCLPVCYTWKDSNDVWHIRYYHIGDYSFTQLPYFWEQNYDKTKAQILGHNANSNGVRWLDTGTCEE